MTLSPQTFDSIRAFVRQKSAINLEAGKEYLVESRLTPVVKAHSLRDLAHLADTLRTNPRGPVADAVIEAMTTNETSFFRDIRPFETLKNDVFPELIERRASQRKLTIWSAACSTGQEAYSIGMLLTEHFPQIASWNVRIIGTDLSKDVVKQAQEASYSQLSVNRGVPAPMLLKYFDRAGMQWKVKEQIRKLAEFRQLNLIENWAGLPTFDLVLLRNVLIYFDTPTREQILRRVQSTLAPDGLLMLGSTESTIGLDVPFRRDNAAQGCLRPAGAGNPPVSPPSTAGARTKPVLTGRPVRKGI